MSVIEIKREVETLINGEGDIEIIPLSSEGWALYISRRVLEDHPCLADVEFLYAYNGSNDSVTYEGFSLANANRYLNEEEREALDELFNRFYSSLFHLSCCDNEGALGYTSFILDNTKCIVISDSEDQLRRHYNDYDETSSVCGLLYKVQELSTDLILDLVLLFKDNHYVQNTSTFQNCVIDKAFEDLGLLNFKKIKGSVVYLKINDLNDWREELINEIDIRKYLGEEYKVFDFATIVRRLLEDGF